MYLHYQPTISIAPPLPLSFCSAPLLIKNCIPIAINILSVTPHHLNMPSQPYLGALLHFWLKISLALLSLSTLFHVGGYDK